MTSKVHKFSRWWTWWAILGILEEDEAVEEFTAVASDVSKKSVVFGLYSGCIEV